MSSICGQFINCTETIGIVIGAATETTTGSLFLTFLIIMILIIAAATMFGIPLEWTSIIILPLLLGYMAYYSEFIAFGACVLIYLAMVLTKNFLFK